MSESARLKEAVRSINRFCPIASKAFLSRKFALPAYRAADYYDQDMINQLSLMMLMIPTMSVFKTDDVVQSQLLNLFQALKHDRPTLFLERELGEILVKTEIPGFIETEDIHFPFPSIRVMLPKRLLGLPKQDRWVMFIDIGHLPKDSEVGCPTDIAMELDRYGRSGVGRLTRMSFTYPEHALAISAQLDHGFAASYATTKPLKGTLESFKGYQGNLRSEYPNDEEDKVLLAGMEKLAVNILLILSSMPLEYDPLVIERKEHREGKRTIPALVRAKWVGDHLLRAKRAGHVMGKIPEMQPKLAPIPHWVSGHWKHQPHGKGFALRRLIYVLPYRTGATASGSCEESH